MSKTTADISPATVAILRSSHFTATLRTETGSHYTLVVRPHAGAVLIHDDKGWVVQGKRIRVAMDNSIQLFGEFKGEWRVLARTTPVVHAYILSN